MALTLLQICQEALEEIGVDPPTTIISGGDLGAQLKALANSTGRDIALRGDWVELRQEGTFTTAATEEQIDLADDSTLQYVRKIVDNSMWNRTQQRRVFGPVSVQAWQRIKADTVTPATLVFYMRGTSILFPGTPTASETVAFEWIDKRWVRNSAGTSYYERFQADTDEPRIDDYAMVLGVRWRFLQRKGLEYGEVFRNYEDYVQERLGSNTPKQTLSMNPHERPEGYDTQIPEGSWNL